jgi:acyl-homoserine lactone acylase PvdQ
MSCEEQIGYPMYPLGLQYCCGWISVIAPWAFQPVEYHDSLQIALIRGISEKPKIACTSLNSDFLILQLNHWSMLKSIHLVFLLFGFSCASPEINRDLARWEQQAANVEIIRDDFGVPHIYGKSDADAVFGLLYAQCEDDFPRVEQNYIWAIGRLAEVEGEEAIYSDLRARLFMTREEAINKYQSAPEWLKKLCQAFADGVNYYLHTHPKVRPRLLTRFEPWMPMYFSEGSIGGDIERVSVEGIRIFYQQQLEMKPVEAQVFFPSELYFLEEPQGSNGIALSGDLTRSGNTMLLINPHTSFYFRGEVHVVSEEGLNAYGAVTWGQFFVYQGFNEKTGWMHTSTYTDVIDEFVQDVQYKDGVPMYLYGDQLRPVKTSTLTLKYRERDGRMKEREFPVYHTHHGPITHLTEDRWTATALMWKPLKALAQSYKRTKLNNHGEFREMMNMRTNSSNNTVYADAQGTIGYYHGNFIPIRDPQFDYSKPVDGSDPRTDWQGLHPVDECITLFNPPNGWIQNCNSTPFTSAAEYSPKKQDYPSYMSIDRENYRGLHAIRLLTGSKDFTINKLINLAYDPYLTGFEVLIPGLIEAYHQRPEESLKRPMEVLREWDYRVSINSVAMSLAHFYGTICYQDGQSPAAFNNRPMERLNYFGTDAPYNERLDLFRKALNEMEERYGTWDVAWGEINRFQRLTGDINSVFDDDEPSIPVGLASGNWGALAAYGDRQRDRNKKFYGTRGNSFVAVVEFGDRVKAKSLLAGGQSGDPDSPHFYDQAQRYADARFKDVAYYREDVEARAVSKYRPGY